MPGPFYHFERPFKPLVPATDFTDFLLIFPWGQKVRFALFYWSCTLNLNLLTSSHLLLHSRCEWILQQLSWGRLPWVMSFVHPHCVSCHQGIQHTTEWVHCSCILNVKLSMCSVIHICNPKYTRQHNVTRWHHRRHNIICSMLTTTKTSKHRLSD